MGLKRLHGEADGLTWGPRSDESVKVLYCDGVEVGRVEPLRHTGGHQALYGATVVAATADKEAGGLYDKLLKYAAARRPLRDEIEPGDFLLLSYGAGTQVVFVDLGSTDKALVIWRLQNRTDKHPGYWNRTQAKLSRNDPRIIKRLSIAAVPFHDGARYISPPEDAAYNARRCARKHAAGDALRKSASAS